MKVEDSKERFQPIIVDRELTDNERTLAVWMLENGDDNAKSFLPELEKARVNRLCGCGCASIDFKIDGKEEPAGGIRILGDFIFGEGDETCGAFIFERDGVLSGIEVYSYGTMDLVKALPKPSQLRKYDEG